MRSTRNERLNKIDAKETEEVDEGCDERNDSSNFGESDNVEGRMRSDLVAPPVEEVIRHGEKEREENAVG